MFVIAALTVTAAIWAITEPESPEDLTMDDMAEFRRVGFRPMKMFVISTLVAGC
jgi:hypothetical protein